MAAPPPDRRGLWLAISSLLGLLAYALLLAATGDPAPAKMAGIATWMAALWVSEALPIPATSMIPLVAFPVLGIADLKATASEYAKPVVFLFLGGILLALGLQRSGLHTRLALVIVRTIGSRPRQLILGFMIAAAALSMWIANTASVMVLLPIGLAVLSEAKARTGDHPDVAILGTAVMLGIAYAADMGGMATPVGTPPNLVMLELYSEVAPDAEPISFAQWMLFGLPLSVLFVGLAWALLAFVVFPIPDRPMLGDRTAIASALRELGPVHRDEWLAGGVFACTAMLWVTGSDLVLGDGQAISGWRTLTGLSEVSDGAIAIAGALVLFALPSARHGGENLLEWETAREVPWGLVLLFGGGFALASGFGTTGLSTLIGEQMTALAGLPTVGMVGLVSLVITFMTEMTSNTATTTLVLPILASAAPALEVDPRVLMIPATLSASCAFMMPVASPTQAIVFGSGYVTIKQMVRAGIGCNLLGVVLVTALFAIWGPFAFGLSL